MEVVCDLVSSGRVSRFANNLKDYSKTETNAVEKILERWINELRDKATLEQLFSAMYLTNLFAELTRHIEKIIKEK